MRIDAESETLIPVKHVAIPILEAGARTGVSTTDTRAGIGVGEDGDPMYTLQSGKQHAIGFYANDSGNDAGDNISPTLRAMDGGGGNHPAVAFRAHGQDEPTPYGVSPPLCGSIEGGTVPSAPQSTMAVRRLLPIECCRLQGFTDDFFDGVIHNGKPPADGPRYKALGNSMAVPVLTWIGSRIKRT